MPEVGELYGSVGPLCWDGSKWVKQDKVPAEAIADAETSYTNWTIQAIYDTGVNVTAMVMMDGGYDMVGIRNDGRVLWHDYSAHTIDIISAAGVVLATLRDVANLKQSNLGVRYHSLTDRFILFIDEGYDDLIVQEGLVKRWRRAVDLDKGAYTLDGNPLTPLGVVSISPSGEWIAAMVKEADTGNGLIFIYKGAT